jgi:hypothetical protein
LQVVVGAYRLALQYSTGYSPAELVYERSPRLPSDLLWNELLQHPRYPRTHIDQLKTHQQAARNRVEGQITACTRTTITKLHVQRARRMEVPNRRLGLQANLHVGEGQYSKIRDHCVRPYRVLRLHCDNNCIIQFKRRSPTVYAL